MNPWKEMKKFEEFIPLIKLMLWLTLCLGTMLGFLLLLAEKL